MEMMCMNVEFEEGVTESRTFDKTINMGKTKITNSGRWTGNDTF